MSIDLGDICLIIVFLLLFGLVDKVKTTNRTKPRG